MMIDDEHIVNCGIINISVDDGIHGSWRLDSMEIFVLIKMINWSNLFRGDSFHHRVFPCHEGKNILWLYVPVPFSLLDSK